MENLTPKFFENPATIFLIAAIVLIIFGIGFTIGAIAALFLFAYYSGYFNK